MRETHDARQLRNFKFPREGMSGSLMLMSLIFCGMFISLTAETALAGAPARPASFCETGKKYANKTANLRPTDTPFYRSHHIPFPAYFGLRFSE